MLTRKDLVAEVEALAKDLGEEVSTDRLNNATLSELAAQLRERLEESTRPQEPSASGETAPSTETAPPVRDQAPPQRPLVDGAANNSIGGQPPPMPRAQTVPKAPYYVAPGKSVSGNVQGRVIGPLREVMASDFHGGQKDLDYLVLKGAVIRSA
jgi:hypothetical protein